MKKIAGLAHHPGSTCANDLGAQGRSSQPQTSANPNAPLPQTQTQTTRSGSNRGAFGVRSATFTGVTITSNVPVWLMPRSNGRAIALQDSLASAAARPLRSSPSNAVLTADEHTQALAVRPSSYKNYSEQWEAWKNEDHPSNENRTEAVKRMKRLLKLEMGIHEITPSMSILHLAIPCASSGLTLNLSSLGLSSLPPWLPPARKVNLDNNRLTSVPINLITQLTDVREGLIVKPEIRLTNNPLPVSEVQAIQSIADSSGYQGPKLVLPRLAQGYETDRPLPQID